MKAKKSPASRSNGRVAKKQLYDNLAAKCRRLERQLAETRSEHDRYLKALYAVTDEFVDFDKDAAFSNLGKRVPLLRMIAELQSSGK